MIRAIGRNNRGGKILILGIDDENAHRLTHGQPIMCRGDTVGVSFDVVIVHGHTLGDVKRYLEETFTLPDVVHVGRGPTFDEIDKAIAEARAEGERLWLARQTARGTMEYESAVNRYNVQSNLTAVLIDRREAMRNG